MPYGALGIVCVGVLLVVCRADNDSNGGTVYPIVLLAAYMLNQQNQCKIAAPECMVYSPQASRRFHTDILDCRGLLTGGSVLIAADTLALRWPCIQLGIKAR
jgi:hypothetical protein